MNVLIANSEAGKTKILEEFLHQYDRKINILAIVSTIEELKNFLSINASEIDLAFFDMQLAGGTDKEIISRNFLSKLLVYTSPSKDDAYHAIKANCFDFILEPFEYLQVSQAVGRAESHVDFNAKKRNGYKKRFMIKFGDKIQFKTTDDISYIFAEGKMAYIITRSTNRKYIIEYTLDELEKTHLDPSNFYRINRKFIVNIEAIEEARNYVNSRLKLIINPATDFDMVVSREKVHDFKNWLNL